MLKREHQGLECGRSWREQLFIGSGPGGVTASQCYEWWRHTTVGGGVWLDTWRARRRRGNRLGVVRFRFLVAVVRLPPSRGRWKHPAGALSSLPRIMRISRSHPALSESIDDFWKRGAAFGNSTGPRISAKWGPWKAHFPGLPLAASKRLQHDWEHKQQPLGSQVACIQLYILPKVASD